MFKRLFIALFALFIAVGGWYLYATQPVTSLQASTVEFEIASGMTVDEILEKLSQSHLIRSRAAMKLTIMRLGIASKIQAGYIDISPSQSATQIALSLTHAKRREVKATIPEGLRREEIASILAKSFEGVSESTFSRSEFLKLTQGKEGYLFPDTYSFSLKSSTQDVVDRLTSQFDKVIAELEIPAASLKRTVIIASLLEREAGDKSELPMIAGIVENRIKANWALGIDASVQYALTTVKCANKETCDWWPKSLTRDDLAIKSALNTYTNPGLIPAPICNPGRASLSAAHNPTPSSYWFYLHDSDGKIHYAKTIEEHNQNICTYLKKDCN